MKIKFKRKSISFIIKAGFFRAAPWEEQRLALLEIVRHPHDALNLKSSPVFPGEDGLRRLVEDLFETMLAAGVCGLSANQVGLNKRLAVLGFGMDGKKGGRLVLLNPRILAMGGVLEEEERCPSLPGLVARPRRAAWTRVQAWDTDGKTFEVKGKGLLAKTLQHELDHLDGRTFLDCLTPA